MLATTSGRPKIGAVRESANKSAASAASLDYAKFQAVIKSAASAASLRGGRASGRLDHGFLLQYLGALAPKHLKKYKKYIFLFLAQLCATQVPGRGRDSNAQRRPEVR